MHCYNFKEEGKLEKWIELLTIVFSCVFKDRMLSCSQKQLPNSVAIKVTLILVAPVLCGCFLQCFKPIGICDII